MIPLKKLLYRNPMEKAGPMNLEYEGWAPWIFSWMKRVWIDKWPRDKNKFFEIVIK